MQDSARGSTAARERASVEGSNVSAKRQSRRRWSTEEKARVVRESLRPGERVGEVARRYGISRWQLSTWRSLARQGKLAVASSAEAVGVERHRSKCGNSSLHTRAGLSRGTQCSGSGVSNDARARQRPWISAVSARADTGEVRAEIAKAFVSAIAADNEVGRAHSGSAGRAAAHLSARGSIDDDDLELDQIRARTTEKLFAFR